MAVKFSWSPQQIQWLFAQMGMPQEALGGGGGPAKPQAPRPASRQISPPQFQHYAGAATAPPPEPPVDLPPISEGEPTTAPDLPGPISVGADTPPTPSGILDLPPPPSYIPTPDQYPSGTGPDYIPPPAGIGDIPAPNFPPITDPSQYPPGSVGPGDIPPPAGIFDLPTPPEVPNVPNEQPINTSTYPPPDATLPPNPFDSPIIIDPSIFQNRVDLVYGPQNPTDPVDTPVAQQPNAPSAPTDPSGGTDIPTGPTGGDIPPPTGIGDIPAPPELSPVNADPSPPGISPSGFPVGSSTPDPVFRGGPLPGSTFNLGASGGNIGGWGGIFADEMLRHYIKFGILPTQLDAFGGPTGTAAEWAASRQSIINYLAKGGSRNTGGAEASGAGPGGAGRPMTTSR